MKISPAILLILSFTTLIPGAAQAQRVDYPELSQRLPNPVGYRQIEVVDHNRIDFLKSDLTAQKIVAGDRHIFVTIWYPAASGDVKTVAHYDRHPGAGPGSPYADSAQFPQTGSAILNAAAVKGKAPLVILSHGFTNWATYFLEMGETLASRGYVVASIDHDDIPYHSGSDIGRAFVDTSSGRARDQRAVAAELRKLAGDAAFPLSGTYDPDNLAVMGYSMGGFGTLQSAGAGFDPNGAFFKRLPKPVFEGELEDQTQPIPGLKAIVMFAPWGGQPANRAWSEAGIAKIAVPALVVDGDHDDVAGFKEGVHWIYDSLKSERYLLVFENANHNIVGASAPESVQGSFAMIEKWDEPVWRKDRIRAIDKHFVVAFLGRYLRGDAAMDSYLNLPVTHSNEGVWPLQPGQDAGSDFAGKDASSAGYWTGFQRRWALGLEFYHYKAAAK